MPQLNLIDPTVKGNFVSPANPTQKQHHVNTESDHRDNDSQARATEMPQISEFDLDAINQDLENADATDVVKWAAETCGEGLVMSTSFGIQSAVMLHLVTQILPDIPVIWIDTGYLPAETYVFAEELTQRLNLNLKVYQSQSPYKFQLLLL